MDLEVDTTHIHKYSHTYESMCTHINVCVRHIDKICN